MSRAKHTKKNPVIDLNNTNPQNFKTHLKNSISLSLTNWTQLDLLLGITFKIEVGSPICTILLSNCQM